jgi:hypothetical protein
LFHGTTQKCVDGLCKVFPRIGESEETIQNKGKVLLGPGLYLTPFYALALGYACSEEDEIGVVIDFEICDMKNVNQERLSER